MKRHFYPLVALLNENSNNKKNKPDTSGREKMLYHHKKFIGT